MPKKIIAETTSAVTEASADDTEGAKRQLKEMVFLQSLRDIDKDEKDREFQTQRKCIGSDLLLDEEVQKILATREKMSSVLSTMHRAKQRIRWSTTMFGSHTLPMIRSTCRSLNVAKPAHRPIYNLYNNDLWAMRKRTLQKFVTATNTIIVRRRVSSRLKLIKKRLSDANARTRQEVRELVDLDNRQAAAGASVIASTISKKGGRSQAEEDRPPFDDIDVDLVSFPQFLDGGGEGAEGSALSSSSNSSMIEVSSITDFDHLQIRALKIPEEADLLQYTEEPTPMVSLYFDLENSRAQSLRKGAEEEEPVRLNVKIPGSAEEDDSSVAEDGGSVKIPNEDMQDNTPDDNSGDNVKKQNAILEKKALPNGAFCWLEPLPTLPSLLLLPDASVRVFERNDMYTECDPEYILLPKPIELSAPDVRRSRFVREYGGCSLGALEGVLTISRSYRPHRERHFSCGIDHSEYEDLWDPNDVPPLLVNRQDEDMMSDTDSDDEDENFEDEEPLWPSVDSITNVFLQPHNDAEGSPSDDNKEPPQLGPRLDFDKAFIALAESRELERQQRSQQLPEALDAVEKSIEYPKNKLSW